MNSKNRKLYKVDEIKDYRELVSRTVNKYPNNVAYKYKIIKGKNDFEYIEKTYLDLKSDLESFSTMLLNLGLEGKKIALICKNRYEWVVSYLGTTTGNMVIVPIDRALKEGELESLIKRSGVEAVVCEESNLDVMLRLKSSNDCELNYIICIDDTQREGVLLYEEILSEGKKLLNNGDKRYEQVIIDSHKMSVLLFTSGTTNASKGVMLSQSNICSDISAIAGHIKLYPDDSLLSFLPIHHTFESTMTIFFGIYSGVTVAFCDGIKYIQKNMVEYKISVFITVPLVLENIYKKVWKGIDEKGKTKLMRTLVKITRGISKVKIDLKSKVFKPIINDFGGRLRLILCGAAPMDKDIILGYNNFGISLIQGYGLTETSPVLTTETDKRKRIGSIGFPLYNVEMKIDNPDENGVGEIIVKGPTLMLGYYENEDATKKAIKDGWFYTGDYGHIDKDGYVFISGRKSDVIVLKNGKNVYPQELEFLLNGMGNVVESIVFARNKDSMDTALCAKIVYNEESFKDKNEEEIKEVLWQEVKEINKGLPDVKHIKEVIVTKEPLSKTTTQKIKRYEEIKKSN